MTISRRHFSLSTLIPAAASAWGSWSPPALAASSHPGLLSIALSLEPDSLDPTSAASASIGEVVLYNVLEGLTKIKENGEIEPLLARSWVRSADGMVYAFDLHAGVAFHDGQPCDAAAVKLAFERAKSLGAANKLHATLFDNLVQIEAPTPGRVVLHLAHPDSNLLFRLGDSPAVITHPLQTSRQISLQPLGTGPFRLTRWVRGRGVELEKFEPYRRANQIALNRAEFRFYPDPAAQTQALLDGEADILFNIGSQHTTRFRLDPRFQVLTGMSSGKGLLAMNHRRRPLNDVRVRRAITHAIDREDFIDRVINGQGRAIGSHFAPTEPGYVHMANMYPYNPRRATALLKEAGISTPLTLTLSLPPAPYALLGGPVLQEHLKQVGIQLNLQILDWQQWLNGPFKGQFDLTLINHVEALDYPIYGDPDYYFGYDSPAFRQLLLRHGTTLSPREKQILLAGIQRKLAEDAVNAWIYTPETTSILRKGIQGWRISYPVFSHDLSALRGV